MSTSPTLQHGLNKREATVEFNHSRQTNLIQSESHSFFFFKFSITI